MGADRGQLAGRHAGATQQLERRVGEPDAQIDIEAAQLPRTAGQSALYRSTLLRFVRGVAEGFDVRSEAPVAFFHLNQRRVDAVQRSP